jgi:hypothetical protein
MANATGRVVQILGGVVDVEFPKEISLSFEGSQWIVEAKSLSSLKCKNTWAINGSAPCPWTQQMVFSAAFQPLQLVLPLWFQ